MVDPCIRLIKRMTTLAMCLCCAEESAAARAALSHHISRIINSRAEE